MRVASKVIPQSLVFGAIQDRWFQLEFYLERIRRAIKGMTDFKEVSVATTLTENEYYVVVDTTGGGITITLPTSATNRDKQYYIKKKVAANNLTIAASGTDTIEGAATLVLAAAYAGSGLISDGTGVWYRF